MPKINKSGIIEKVLASSHTLWFVQTTQRKTKTILRNGGKSVNISCKA